jgi:O-antigen/teichoic acid export membrane protein
VNFHNLKHPKVRAAISAGAVKTVALLLGLAVSVVLARNLGAEAYGTYGLVISIVTVLALPLHAGLPAYLMREVVRQSVDENWPEIRGLTIRIIQWIVVGGLLIVVLILGLWVCLGERETDSSFWYLLIASPLIPLIAMNSTRAAILRGFKQILLSQIPQNLVQPVTQAIFVFAALYYLHLSVETAIAALVLASLFSVLAAIVLVRRHASIPSNEKPSFNTALWLRSALPFSLLAVITIGNTQISTLIMGLVTSPEEIGYLRIATKVSQLVVFSLMIVNLVSAPHLAELAKRRKWVELERLAVMSARGALAAALPLALALVFLGKPFIRVLFGEDFVEPVWLPLAIVSLGQLFNVYFGSIANVLNMSGFEKETIRGMALGLAVNSTITAILAPLYGATGAAIGFSCSMWLWNYYLSIRIRKRLSVRVSAI